MAFNRRFKRGTNWTFIVAGAACLIALQLGEAWAGSCSINSIAYLCDITCQGTSCRQAQVACDGADSDDGGAKNDGYCTVCGNSSANTMYGGTTTDAANGVKDRICGGGGNDTITSSNNNSLIDAAAGDDSVSSSGSGSVVYGKGGNDTISVGPDAHAFGDEGNDSISLANTGTNYGMGGDGNDTIIAGDGDNWVQGGAGDDSITAGDGFNRLDGGAGEDTIISGVGGGEFTGGDDDDSIKCEGGDNIISGGGGIDLLVAGPGDDTIFGGSGSDSIYGGGGADFLDGQQDSAVVVTNKTYVEGDDPVCSTTVDYLGATLCNGINVDACGYGHQCIGNAWLVTYENLGTSTYDVATMSSGVLQAGSDSVDSRKPSCGCYHDFYYE